MARRKVVVTIGGGTGSFVVLSALRYYPVHCKAIISMADDGGSTGVLRDQYGILPPGDVRRALVALSDADVELRALFNYRFTAGGLGGHSFGNIFLTALERMTGSFISAIHTAEKILKVRGTVIPVTTDNVRLHARLIDGTHIRGEANIDVATRRRAPIREVWLEPRARIFSDARRAIASADIIVIGPGDLYTSIIPNLLVDGVSASIRRSSARKIFVVNLMTKRGETDGFRPEDFVSVVERYLGFGVLDVAICNRGRPPAAVLRRYAHEGATFVPSPRAPYASRPRYLCADFLERGAFARHGPRRKLGRVIYSLLR